MLWGIKECLIKSFAFCYNNACRIYKDAKYSASYWPQELVPIGCRGTNELVRRSDIKDNEFDIGKVFYNNKAIKAAYWEWVDLRDVILEVEDNSTIE